MPKKKKPTRWQKIKRVLGAILSAVFSPKTGLAAILAIIAGALLSLSLMSATAYDTWRADRATEDVRILHHRVQGILDNMAPMVEMCVSQGHHWVWLGVDPAEVRGICAVPKRQAAPEQEKQNYDETL